jgi:hypothetical protein
LRDAKTGKIMVPAGSKIVVTSAGKLRTNSNVKIEGDKFDITVGKETDKNGDVTELWGVEYSEKQ